MSYLRSELPGGRKSSILLPRRIRRRIRLSEGRERAQKDQCRGNPQCAEMRGWSTWGVRRFRSRIWMRELIELPSDQGWSPWRGSAQSTVQIIRLTQVALVHRRCKISLHPSVVASFELDGGGENGQGVVWESNVASWIIAGALQVLACDRKDDVSTWHVLSRATDAPIIPRNDS